MSHANRLARSSWTTRLGFALGTAVLALAVAAPPATAGRGHHKQHKHHKHHKQYKHHDHDRYERHDRDHYRHSHAPAHYRHGASFVVPTLIRAHHAERYGAYYRGAAYYRPHRHTHEVYYFPVQARGSWTHRPHYYCGHDLYLGHDDVHGYVSYSGPRVSFSLGF